MKSKINPILSKVVEITGLPAEVVGEVINHTFTSIRSYLINPALPGLRIPQFGIIRPDLKRVYSYLGYLVLKLRTNRTEELIEEFRVYWKLRHAIRADIERRKYKKRYGTWHW